MSSKNETTATTEQATPALVPIFTATVFVAARRKYLGALPALVAGIATFADAPVTVIVDPVA